MAKVGESIVEKENQQKSIERLAAQKEVYFQAKRLFFWQFLVTTVMTAVLALLALVLLYFGRSIDWVRASYGIAVAFADLFLFAGFINFLKQKAATIQECFDCDVLELDWNQILVGDKPLAEDIKKYSDKHLLRVKNFDKLKNWYAETIKDVDGPAAKLICQRSNFAYDYAIRKSFLRSVIFGTIAVLLLVALCALIANVSSRSLVVTLALPILPILTFSGKLYSDHKGSIGNLESLRKTLSSVWSGLLAGNPTNPETFLRQIQDKIYLNRKNSPLVPERFYEHLRSNLEQEMHYSVSDLVDEYKHSLDQKMGR